MLAQCAELYFYSRRYTCFLIWALCIQKHENKLRYEWGAIRSTVLNDYYVRFHIRYFYCSHGVGGHIYRGLVDMQLS